MFGSSNGDAVNNIQQNRQAKGDTRPDQMDCSPTSERIDLAVG
jgi:hypothetical protein